MDLLHSKLLEFSLRALGYQLIEMSIAFGHPLSISLLFKVDIL